MFVFTVGGALPWVEKSRGISPSLSTEEVEEAGEENAMLARRALMKEESGPRASLLPALVSSKGVLAGVLAGAAG